MDNIREEIKRKIALRMTNRFKEEQRKSSCRKWFDLRMRRFRNKMMFYEAHGFSKIFVIKQDNNYYAAFTVILTLSCLISSYVYAYIAAFRLHA